MASQKLPVLTTIKMRRQSRYIDAGQQLGGTGDAEAPSAKEATVRDEDLGSLAWRKSSACWEAQCVVVAADADQVLIRDSSDAKEKTLAINNRDWADFMAQIRDSMAKGMRGDA
jgi:hypothetical protein